MSQPSASEPAWQARVPFYYGWVIVSVVFLTSFTTAGGLWATGVLSVPMHEDLGWSRATIFAGITLRTLGAAFMGAYVGRIVDRSGGARWLGLFGGLVSAVCLLLVAFVQEPWQFLLVFGVIGGLLGNGPVTVMIGAVVPKWFILKRGKAMATASMGTGLAAFILPTLVNLISDSMGWREAWFALGLITVVLGVLPCVLLYTRPEDVGMLPDGNIERPRAGQPTVARVATPEFSFTRKEAFKTSTIWLLVVAVMFGTVSPTAFPTNLVPAYVERGFSTGTAAIAFSAYGALSFFGRFIWGALADRMHISRLLLIIATYAGLTVPLLLLLPGDTALLAGAIAGLGIGGWVGLNQVVWASYFGRDNVGAISGAVRPFVTISGASGPLLVAALADAFGSYTVSIIVMAASWWFCAALLFVIKPPRLPERPMSGGEEASGVPATARASAGGGG
jgi:MFS family permease